MPSPNDGDQELLLNEEAIANKIRRLSAQILESHPQKPPALIGIHTRGVILAKRVREILEKDLGQIPLGTLDISLYRDDLAELKDLPSLRGSEIQFDLNEASVIIFDDVLYTGRTIKAAIDSLSDYGRPAKIELAVLIDRGNRELPIMANYTGMDVRTRPSDYIKVRFRDEDDEESITLIRKSPNP